MSSTAVHRPLLGMRQAAQYLGVSERWLRRQVAEKQLHYVKMRKLVMFRPDDLDAYVEANLRNPTTGEQFAMPPYEAPRRPKRRKEPNEVSS